MPKNLQSYDNPGAETKTMVIAPCTFWMDLMDETGDTVPSPEFISGWTQRNDPEGGSVAVIALGHPQSAAPIAVDGAPVTDLTGYEEVRLDYCAGCALEGHDRLATLTTPKDEAREGTVITAYYQCPRGHTWTCHWSAREFA